MGGLVVVFCRASQIHKQESVAKKKEILAFSDKSGYNNLMLYT